MHPYARAFLVVVALLAVASCSDTDSPLVPTELSGPTTSRLVVEATSATTVAERIATPFCPTVTPFNVRLGVIVTATGSLPVTITGIRARFTDTFGRAAPQVAFPSFPVTLPAIGPTLQFGESQVRRTFPLVLGIGCGTDEKGTVVIVVDSSDGRGRRMTEQVTIAVR
jgi:hypothetical protein